MSKPNKTESNVNKFETYLERYRKMTINQLAQEFSDAVAATTDGLTKMAALVASCDERGAKPPHMDAMLLANLRKIAQGTLAVETFIALGNNPMVMGAIGRLPLKEQIGVVKRGHLEVAVPTRDGVSIENRDLTDLGRKDVKAIFNGPKVRPIKEQVAIIEAKTDPSNTRDREYATVIMSVADKMALGVNAKSLRMSVSEYLYSLAKQGGGFDRQAQSA